MQKSFRRSVRWDRQATSYQVIEQAGSTIRTSDLDFQSHVWQQWLGQGSSFAFQSKDGHHFTARKEARGRGDAYWIAYRKMNGKLTHKYLGRPTDITLSKMEQVAATLAGQERERKQGPTPYLDRLLAAFAQEERAVQATQPLLPDRISPREREVLHLLAQGCSNQEIADALVVTVETVKRHVSSLLAKLGVDNRTQAALRARSLGLLSDEP